MYGARVSRPIHSSRYKELRDLLSSARLGAALTQAELAARLKRPQSFVSKYETGERQLDVLEFVDVCKALGVSPATIVKTLSR